MIEIELFIFIFLLGLVVGSFLNVLILRHEKAETVTGRSRCMACGKQLTWRELIPVLSFLIQKGKCKNCGVKLSVQYPLVELGTGILFVLVYAHVAQNDPLSSVYAYILLVLALTIWALSLVITVYDLRTKLIPNVFSYTLAGLALIYAFADAVPFFPSLWHLLAGPLLFLPFYLLWKVSDGIWLGLGDGKLALGIGWFLGLAQGGTAILYAFWIGAGVSLFIMGIQRMRNSAAEDTLTLKSEVPFGPFMVAGALLVYLFELNLFSYF